MQENDKAEAPVQEEAVPPNTDQEQLITPKRKPKTHCKCFKIFSCILLIIIILLIAVFLFFALHIFKKRPIHVDASNATLKNLSYSITPIMLNVIMGVNISIENPNYAGFKYESTNMTFFYHGNETGMSPWPAGVVKLRSTKKLHNTLYINATNMINSPLILLPELIRGRLPLSSRTYMVGKVTLFNYIKIHTTVLATCNITVNLINRNTSAVCKSDVKIF
ncbi:Late embryogenesis abundant protein [Carex littledalei]|uniref:Late embryogenesis abundant protein n=1 Tax=Carex littledalei TaxID=544730 RepID=A0A833VDJ3_9POAL|nr:Late embryogenesis abundant protein [Carex littledalei]